MLDIIKHKLNNIRTDCSTIELAKISLAKIVDEIEKYQKSRETLSDVHATFRTLDEYMNMYNAELTSYAAIPRTDKKKCSFKIQELVCILAMMGSLLNNVLRKYNTTEDKSTLAKHLRRLNEYNEYVRGEKIMWQSALKSLTTLIQADIASVEYQPFEE